MNEFKWISLDVVTSSVVEKILMSKSKKCNISASMGPTELILVPI